MEKHDSSKSPTKKSDSSTMSTTITENPHTVTDDIQQIVTECYKRANSCIENSKYKITISSERLAQLRKTVDTAIREHKIFTIKGCWPVVRRELLRRHWIERYEPGHKKPQSANSNQNGNTNSNSSDELVSNLPIKLDWESPSAYTEKCERTVMSRMLQNYDVDLYWSMRKDHPDLQHRTNSYKIINRFCRSLFASKEGLSLLLQQSYWHTEANVSSINYPRCYVLGFPEHFNYFVEDFRLTACMGLIKWFVSKYEKEDRYAIQSPEGHVPYSALQFAIDRCAEYIATQKHMDIDREDERTWEHEWNQFLTNYSMIMYRNLLFEETKTFNIATLYHTSKTVLNELRSKWPEIDIDGMRNIWILKPGNKCRGRGIQLIKDISEVERVMNLKLKYVVQKYIEKPLIIYKTKFDIRQWFMITSAQPLTIWMYRDSYLRFSSQVFSLENFHESLHLTNHAVQCKYTNTEQRDKALPNDNMWDCHTFKSYLEGIGRRDAWDKIIYPGMREGIICAMLCSQETMDRRQNTFEVYGADFMLSEDLRPWLLEINCCPDMSSSTSVTRKMCPSCMEDVLKVVVDKRRDPKADTGLFDLIYKQNLPRIPPYLGMNLCVRGKKLFKNRNRQKLKASLEYEREKDEPDDKLQKKKYETIKIQLLQNDQLMTHLPKILSPQLYKGPIIEDLIEDLQKSINSEETGVDFVPAIKTDTMKKKSGLRGDRKTKRLKRKL